jgi:hypothetical protein
VVAIDASVLLHAILSDEIVSQVRQGTESITGEVFQFCNLWYVNKGLGNAKQLLLSVAGVIAIQATISQDTATTTTTTTQSPQPRPYSRQPPQQRIAIPAIGLEILAVRHATDWSALQLGLNAASRITGRHAAGDVVEIKPHTQQHLGGSTPQRQPRPNHALKDRLRHAHVSRKHPHRFASVKPHFGEEGAVQRCQQVALPRALAVFANVQGEERPQQLARPREGPWQSDVLSEMTLLVQPRGVQLSTRLRRVGAHCCLQCR